MTDCLPQVHCCAMRVGALDISGVPLPGAENLYVTNSMTKVTLKPVYETGNEITERNACGAVVVDYKSPDSLKRADIEIEIVTPDPFLHQLLADGGVAFAASAGGTGFQYPPIGQITGYGVSIELWTKRINNGALDSTFPYAWWALPKVQNLKLGDREFSETAQKTIFTGECYENAAWFDGPNNDWLDASDRLAQGVPTTSYPDATCGFLALAAT
jgi:hypothetical protein